MPEISAPSEAYRDTPVYVGNEQPRKEVIAWARSKPGFADVWIDRDHNGWITLAFTEGVEARQAELLELFPDVGVVAVEVDWTSDQLDALQKRVFNELGPGIVQAVGARSSKGVVTIMIGLPTDEVLATIEQEFGEDPICIDALDPSLVVPEGPQPQAGDGWRLLASEQESGQAYRTGIATGDRSFAALWTEAGLAPPLPPVDFETEVVIWFGAVYGSSCPGLRLDDVVVDRARAIVHGEIVLPGPVVACTADAVPHAFVVALTRSRLPPGPFAIQLGGEDPQGGATEDRTIVEVDLTVPGAVATEGQVHPDTSTPRPGYRQSGDIIEPGFENLYLLETHCGIEWLGLLNDVWWRTEVPAGATDYVLPEWRLLESDESIVVTVLMAEGPAPTLTATANGVSVTYVPSPDPAPGCD